MTVKNLFIFVALMCLLPGLTMIFATDFMASQYLTDPASVNETARYIAQGWGSMLIVKAIILWYCRDAGPSLARKALILGSLLENLALTVIIPLSIANKVETAVAWGQVLISAVIVVWSGMLLRQEERVVA